jgi:hypothetical protein
VAVVVDRVRADEPLAAGVRQGVDGTVQALLRELLRFTRARAEAGTPEQPFGLGRPEPTAMDWDLACSRNRGVPGVCFGVRP